MKEVIRKLPLLGSLLQSIRRRWMFTGSEDYWIARYASGGSSGAGSYNELSEFKAEIINDFVAENNVSQIIEYGCGDGNQLSLAKYPAYLGFDVSQDVISMCRGLFADDRAKSFKLLKDYNGETAQLTLSLDVIYHLIEDSIFQDHMNRLFDSSDRYVVIYSSDTDTQEHGQVMHVKHRKFTRWIRENKPQWKLRQHIPNRHPYAGDGKTGSLADFYIYEQA